MVDPVIPKDPLAGIALPMIGGSWRLVDGKLVPAELEAPPPAPAVERPALDTEED